MPRAKSDPLIAALIAKLPPANEDWPEDRQRAWLKLMAHALGAMYGGDVAGQMDAEPARQFADLNSRASNIEPFRTRNTHPFVIDEKGMARNQNGDRIMPDEVEGYLYDTRGEDADMGAITWADDSKGIAGLDLTISAA